jgi:hypothetical protein
MLTIRSTPFVFAVFLLSAVSVEAQDTTKQPQPEPKPLPALTVPAGFATFNAACLTFFKVISQGPYTPYAVVWDQIACPAGDPSANLVAAATIKAAVIQAVLSKADTAAILTAANGNFTSVQQAVIDAIYKVLDDQSVKVEGIQGIISAASQQIADEVTQRLQKSIHDEVARQLRAGQR